MRIEGKIIKWKEDRGFGFLAADQGGAEVFAHITAFPRTGTPPVEGERVSFEVELEASGKKRAKNVLYLERSTAAPSATRNRPVRSRQEATSSSPWRTIVIWLAVALVLAAVVYKVVLPRVAPMWQPKSEFSVVEPASETSASIRPFVAPVNERAVAGASDIKAELQAFEEMREADEPIAPAPTVRVREQAASYQCDGRQHCSQMRSCDEAKYFLKNCPNPKMDGDNDGLPCEQDLCAGSF